MTGNAAAMERIQRRRNRFILTLGAFLTVSAGIFGYLLPQITGYQQSAQNAQSSIDDLEVRMREVMAQKESNEIGRQRYAQYQREGFLGMQNRLAAARILEDLRRRYRISSLDYQIDPVSVVNIARQQDSSELELGESKISLSLRGFLDSDLKGFITGLMQEMPGHITVRSVEISKLASPGPQMLLRISRGEAAALVSGEVEVSWRSLHDSSADAAP